MSETKSKSGLKWYEVVYALALIGLLFFGLILNKPHRIGVVDVDRLAVELGLNEVIAGQDQSIRTELTEQLRGLQSQYMGQYAAITNAHPGALNLEGDEFKNQVQALESDMRKEASVVVSEGQRKQRQMMIEYRTRLQPFINQVAKKRRLSLVISSGPVTVYSRASIDITADVLAAAKPHVAELTTAVDLAKKALPTAP